MDSFCEKTYLQWPSLIFLDISSDVSKILFKDLDSKKYLWYVPCHLFQNFPIPEYIQSYCFPTFLAQSRYSSFLICLNSMLFKDFSKIKSQAQDRFVMIRRSIQLSNLFWFVSSISCLLLTQPFYLILV